MSEQAPSYDAIVLGCGPGGSTAGLHLGRLGLSVLALDKEDFPRYHIGESLTGTAGAYLRSVGLEKQMTRRGFPVKYGVKVMGRNARNQFFVAAAPEPTWQVKRADFDEMLLEGALASGMERRQGSAVGVLREGERVVGVRYRDREGIEREVRGRCLVDATGLSTYLSAQGVAGPRVQDVFADQVAVFTQIRDCQRDPGLMAGNTIIFYNEQYHWAWFIPLDDEVVSVGVVVTRDTYLERRQEAVAAGRPVPETVLRWGLDHINPDLRDRCAGREWVEPVRVIREYSYRINPFAGPGWICVGDSHRFIDPIFSFGVSIAIHEGELAAAAIAEGLESGDFSAPFADYQRRCSLGQDAVYDVIRYFWRFPAFFGVQAQGRYRDDIMRLFAGACYDEQPIPGLVMMRESLARVGDEGVAA